MISEDLLPILPALDLSTKYRLAVAEIKEEYTSEAQSLPWIIGFSGGKDSTLMAHMVFEAILDLPKSERRREIIVLSNDTLVESPVLMHHLKLSLEKIREGAESLGLPVKTVITTPPVEQTFWVNLIGRGYPSPNKQFRWCTDRMKIQPMSAYVLSEVSKSGEVILLLGVRSSESVTRAQTIAKHTVEGEKYHRHTELNGCWVYRPILNFTTDEVWQVLLQRQAPWGGSHRDLITVYRNANAGECPLVLDHSQAPSCGTGSARFGCWTCTVVTKDRSMEGLIDAGSENLEPLLDFRDWLVSIRNHRDYRETERRNGTPGAGPFSIEARKRIMERLLRTQEEVGFSLISDQEVELIKKIWESDTLMQADRFVERYYQQLSESN